MFSHRLQKTCLNAVPSKCDVDDIPQDDNTSSGLAAKIGIVSNNTQKLSLQKTTSTDLRDRFLTRVWQCLQVSGDKHSSKKMSDEEEKALRDILIHGETLRQQADSLCHPSILPAVPQAWKGGILKRCLIGVGLLSDSGVLGGAGYAGFKYYHARAANSATTINSQQLGSPSVPLNTMHMHNDDARDLEPPFVHHGLHDDPSAKKARHYRRHQPDFNDNAPGSRLGNRKQNMHVKSALDKANHRVKKLLLGVELLSDQKTITKEKLLYAVSLYLHYNNSVLKKETNIKVLAQKILSGSGLYGENKNEILSIEQAKSVVRHWAFQNILGATPEKYIISKMTMDISQCYTVADIHRLLPVDLPPRVNSFNLNSLREFERNFFSIMWKDFLIEEMPFLIFNDKKALSIALDDFSFADLYSGSFFIKTIKGENLSLEDTLSTGNSIWEVALNEGISENEIIYFRIPTILFYATHSVQEKENEYINSIFLINHYLSYRREVNAVKNDFHMKYNAYLSAIKSWRSKGKLADDIIAICPVLRPGLADLADAIRTPAQKREKAENFAKQDYMNGWQKPCDLAPDDLNDEYRTLTRDVANSFHDIEKYLILSAISALHEEEKKFISASNARIFLVSIIIKNSSQNYTRIMLRDNIDLFSVSINRQERIYALQTKNNSQETYRLIRVDRDIKKYIDNDFFDDNYQEGFFIKNSHLFDDEKSFDDFYLINNESYIGNDSDNIKNLIDELTDKHRIALFHQLYTSGNDNSDLQNVWGVIKHFIPFYDCVEQNIEGNHAEAGFACVIDLISLLPVLGQSAKLGEQFIQGLARGFRSGGIKVTGKNILREVTLPTAAQLASLGESTIMALDPGFSLVISASRVGKNFAEKIVRFIIDKKQMVALARNIDARIATLPSIKPSQQVTGILPGTELEIPVALIGNNNGQNLYTRINPETGEKFGVKYACQKSGILSPVSSIPSRILKRNTYPNENISVYQTHRIKRADNNPNLCSEQPSTSRASQAGTINNKEIVDINTIPLEMAFLPIAKTLPPLSPKYIRRGRKRVRVESLHLANDGSLIGGEIKSTIINRYESNNILIHRFNQNIETIPTEFAQLKDKIQQCRTEVLLAKKFVDDLDSRFRMIEKKSKQGRKRPNKDLLEIEKYLSKTLKLDTLNDPHIVSIIIKESINRLKFHLLKMKDYFDNEINNIYFTSANTNVFHTNVNRKTRLAAFSFRQDAHRRIIILMDYFTPVQISTQLHTVILHEVSHLSGTHDIYINNLRENRADAMEKFNDAALQVDNQFIMFKKGFLKYYQESTNNNVNEKQLLEIIKRDPVLRANLFIDNADFLANIIADLVTLHILE